MYKALLVALIGLFFSLSVSANSFQRWHSSGKTVYLPYGISTLEAANTVCAEYGGYNNFDGSTFRCKGAGYDFGFFRRTSTPTDCSAIPADQLPESCPPVETVLCPNGAAAPGNDLANCPINCDILNGPTDPSCDSETPPDGYCGANQSPVFDDCDYGPDDPRNPDNQPPPQDHCEAFPDSVSCNTELPPFPESDYCKQYPTALECQTPEIPDLGTGTDTGTTPPVGPPPPGGTGVGTDTGTPTTPPPAPPPTDSNSSSNSTDSRLDNLRYDISKLHSGLNYQTGIIARGLTGVSSQLQVNGSKTDRSNTLLDGINKNLDVLNGSLKGDPLTSGNFDVEGGINSALGITGNEKLSDLVAEPMKLEDYTEQYDQFLSEQNLSCSNVLPTVEFDVMGRQYSFDINYQPACDWLSNLGNFLLFVTWIAVPAIVFGRRS